MKVRLDYFVIFISLKKVIEILPSQELSGIISHYSYKEMLVQESLTVPALSEHFMEFYLQGKYQVIESKTGYSFSAPPSIFIGQQTGRNWDLLIKGEYKMFFIHFKPAGFYKLFHIPMHHFTDSATDPALVLSRAYTALQSRLSYAGTLCGMVGIVEKFLIGQLKHQGGGGDKFHQVIEYMVQKGGDVNLNYLVNQCNITVRQFERKFREQIGISPKLFIRKTRFNHLLQLKKKNPRKKWTELTYQSGYFDQAHMNRDFRMFTSDTPSRYLSQINALPEMTIR